MEERRHSRRSPLDVPLHVEGHDADHERWTEMTRSCDVSEGGLAFTLAHRVDLGSLLHLSLPLPRRFRRYEPTASSYKTYALVRDVEGAGPYRVGVKFFGQQAPKGHFDHPGMRYRLPGDRAERHERRRGRRLDIFTNVVLRVPGAGREERTIAENIGRGGARALTSLPLRKGDVVEFEEIGGAFRTRAEVRNVYVGEDRIPRLNLHFIDAPAPEHLVPPT